MCGCVVNGLDWRRVNDTTYHVYDMRASTENDADGVFIGGMLEWWPAAPSRYGIWRGLVVSADTTDVGALGAIHLEQVYSSEQVCDAGRAVEEATLARRVAA